MIEEIGLNVDGIRARLDLWQPTGDETERACAIAMREALLRVSRAFPSARLPRERFVEICDDVVTVWRATGAHDNLKLFADVAQLVQPNAHLPEIVTTELERALQALDRGLTGTDD
ncbi:hypothetical protein [Glycomyces sp. NPDC048151]|uniref:hypothetical protein n=1 Tax=Glycomyces sp. NPDC048151 TaxID=3364002 RepID=UPI00371EE48B